MYFTPKFMKLFSSKNPNYYIEIEGGKVNTSLLKYAIKDSPQTGVEGELSQLMEVEVLTDYLLTFDIDHPYAKWLSQYLPFVAVYKSQSDGDDVKIPDFGYWKNNPFRLIEIKEEKEEGVKLLRIDPTNQVEDFVSFDVESTGVVPAVDRIIQIAAVKYRNNEVVDTFDMFIKPDNFDDSNDDFYITDTIVDLTGIKDSDIKSAPSLKEVADDFLTFVEGEVLIGHNLIFDIEILGAEFERNDIEMPKVSYFDTYVEARDLMPFQPRGGYKLEVLKEKIDMGHLDSHNALNDCLIAGELFKYLNSIN